MSIKTSLEELLRFNDNISFAFAEDLKILYEDKEIKGLTSNDISPFLVINKPDEFLEKTINGYKIRINKVHTGGTLFYTVVVLEYKGAPYKGVKDLQFVLSIINKIPSGIALVKDSKIFFRNKKMVELLELSSNEILIQPSKMLTKKYSDIISKMMTGEITGKKEIFLKYKNKEPMWILVENGFFSIRENKYTILFALDITSQKNTELEFKKEKEQLEFVFESLNESVIITDSNNIITLFNKESELITGYFKEEALGSQITDIVVIIDENENLIKYNEIDSCDNDNLILKSKNDLFRQVVFKRSKVFDNSGTDLGSVITISDISNQKRKEKEIIYLSYHDVLTGLHNRTFFEEQLKLLDTERQYPLAVIMGDVNGLKLTNDVFGHDAGDQLLRNFAKVLKNTCRHEDVIARWGGDEFIVLLPHTNDQQAYIIMNRIIRNIEKLYKSGNLTSIIPSMALGYGVKTDKSIDIYDSLKTAESNMYKRKMLTSSSVYSSIIDSMKTTLYERSNETEEHSERLFKTCKKVAQRYNVSSDELNELELFAVLHDIGKIGISDDILNKEGKLTDEEWKKMKTHPEIGYRIARASKELKGVGEYILTHHEHFDGLGYPRGLKGYKIPLLSRILSVADAFDAMTNDRTYQKAKSKAAAFDELIKCSGTQFDPEVVKIFIEENS